MKNTFTYQELDTLAVNIYCDYLKADMLCPDIVMHVDKQTLHAVQEARTDWDSAKSLLESNLVEDIYLLPMLNGLYIKLITQ